MAYTRAQDLNNLETLRQRLLNHVCVDLIIDGVSKFEKKCRSSCRTLADTH